MQRRLIVVANRLPVTLRRSNGIWSTEQSSGGLASAMRPLLDQTGGEWIGWPGEQLDLEDNAQNRMLQQWEDREHCYAVNLPEKVADLYYEGYANQTLWPVFHNFPSFLRFDESRWQAYREANEMFCDAVVKRYRPGDLVWVHDYHLMLLPEMLRSKLPDATIGFFLHIPFPSAEIFPILPHRENLLQGLLGSDLIAFQTHGHLQQFRAALLRVLGVESKINEAALGARIIRLEALPIGIGPQHYIHLLDHDAVTAEHYAQWVSRYEGRKVLLAVDRLDYTKGVPERLRAYSRLLRSSPGLREKVILIQVAVPSREEIGSYRDLRIEVNQLVGEINGKLGTPNWTPLVYINRSIDQAELVALYKLADVCWVGSLRDGMNLVAKEYVACKPRGDGVLVLSEFAGAAAEMGEALLINPYDEDDSAAAVQRALTMNTRERIMRMKALHKRVLENNVFKWGEKFLASLEDAALVRGRYSDTQPKRLPSDDVRLAYRAAARRLLILDYDGTLVPRSAQLDHIDPPSDLIELLSVLTKDSRNCIALTSSRRSESLDACFGSIRGLWLVAEHGAELKPPGSSWRPLRPEPQTDWKATVTPILEHFVDRIPGSFIEERNYSLVWHYNTAEPLFGKWLANELVAMLEAMLAETELRAFRAEKMVEVKPAWANKGEAFEHLLKSAPNVDFIFAAGDDRTDEDLFERLHGHAAWTVHVGTRPTRAGYCLPDPQDVRAILSMFAMQGSVASTQGLPTLADH